MTEQEFNSAYWAATSPSVRALKDMENQQERALKAFEQATRGFVVDVPIMVWGWSPYLVMKMRQDYGYTWVPSALQSPVSMAPGLCVPGAVPYDPANPPAGSVKVSLDIADYPPFDPPAPPQPVEPKMDPVLAEIIIGMPMYHVTAWYQGEDGARFSGPRGSFVLHSVTNPFGRSRYWEKVG